MKVLSVSYSSAGGISTVQRHLSAEMELLGVEYVWVDARSLAEKNGVLISKLEGEHARNTLTSLWGGNCAHNWVRQSQFHPEVIHCHDYRAAPFAFAVGALKNIPVIMTVHYWFDPTVWIPEAKSEEEVTFIKIREQQQKWAFQNADKVTAVSEYAAKILKNNVSRNCNPKIILNCAPTDLSVSISDYSESEFIFLPARLTGGKGVDLAIKSIVDLPKDIQLIIAGSGPRLSEFQYLTEELGLLRRVKFIGEQPQNILLGLMQKAICTVIPSRWDWYPITVLEAQSVGAVVVASDAGGIPEQIHNNYDGVLFRSNDVDSLKTVLFEIIGSGNKMKRKLLSEGSLQTTNNRPKWRDAAKLYVEVFNSVLS